MKKNKKTRKTQIFDERRKIKFIDTKLHSFTANQAVLGDYIVFIMSNTKPYYMIEIHDRVMAHNLRQTFKLLWDNLD